MDELCIPTEVWMCVAGYYENPVLLLRLAGVCRNSYKGATMDSAWETLIPYECEGNFYRTFIEAALATTEHNRSIIRCCWTGSFPPRKCFPKVAFKRKDFDTAFALAAQKEHACGWPYDYIVRPRDYRRYMCPEKYSYVFNICVKSRKFMITALKFGPWLYDMYKPPRSYGHEYIRYNAEYCEVAMPHSIEAWITAEIKSFQVRKNYELRKKTLTLYPQAFTYVFRPTDPCSDPEFILGSAPSYRGREKHFVECCRPDIFGLELCEELCKIGFPIWIAKPDVEAPFLKRFKNFTELPPMFANDREIFASVAKNNCDIFRNAIPEFRSDIPLVMSIFEHNPGVLHYCDASIFTDAEFLRCFKESLSKPNYFFFRTRPNRYHPGPWAFPGVLQTQELALIAVESYGQWMHYFPRFWRDLEVMKAAVVTWPRAYGYTPHWMNGRYKKDEEICQIDPRAVWFAGEQFIRENRSIVRKALQLEPLPNRFDYYPYGLAPHGILKNIKCVLPEVLRAHPSNYDILCLNEKKRRYILRKKNLVIAALEGTRDSSMLWDVPLEILDEELWTKAREVR